MSRILCHKCGNDDNNIATCAVNMSFSYSQNNTTRRPLELVNTSDGSGTACCNSRITDTLSTLRYQSSYNSFQTLGKDDQNSLTLRGRQPLWQSADARHRRELVQQKVRRREEEDRQVRAVSMKQQGQYMKSEIARQRKISWHALERMDGQKISFLLISVYYALPKPPNQTIWKLIEDPSCELCGKPANLDHVLSSCRTALKDGKYTWRHDQVLREMAAVLDTNVEEEED
ncbi:unnamed protein product [Mytilus edulis]|uniref:Reverse transcriptase zinc-binding domain-containing protein n=1 Tax=Mytilus edulis TaxID=6550 RepID=A0A8S3UH45_MYTED|nr:unnamed protein product [Mytilus edulis]